MINARVLEGVGGLKSWMRVLGSCVYLLLLRRDEKVGLFFGFVVVRVRESTTIFLLSCCLDAVFTWLDLC